MNDDTYGDDEEDEEDKEDEEDEIVKEDEVVKEVKWSDSLWRFAYGDVLLWVFRQERWQNEIRVIINVQGGEISKRPFMELHKKIFLVTVL